MPSQKASEPKRGRGRPAKPAPEPIPATTDNVVGFVLKTRTKAERDKLMGRD